MTVEKGFDVAPRAGKEIIQADDAAVLSNQAFAEMGAEKTGAPSDQNSRFEVHGVPS